MERQPVAIVGAGCSGALLAIQLLRQTTLPVVLIGKRHEAGRGTAYSTTGANHLLNVPAGRMSVFPDAPGDFLQWLGTQGHDDRPAAFAPRQVFGCYVRDRLDAAARAAPGRLDVLDGDVVAIARDGTGTRVQFGGGRALAAGTVVLALGNRPPHPLQAAEDGGLDAAGYRADPWAAGALAGIGRDSAVLLAGTGLTAVDTVVSLLDAGHRGPIVAMSRRGLAPHPHCESHPGAFAPAPYPASLIPLMRRLRQDVREAAACGMPWQSVMECVRHHVQALWHDATEADRARFLRHARPWWDIHRHRIAPAIAARIGAARQAGQLSIIAGRIAALSCEGGGVRVTYTPRGGRAAARMQVAHVVNCTGPASDIGRGGSELLQSLLAGGLCRPDPLRLGIDVTRAGELRGAGGAIVPGLFAVGPITRGAWWEMTSVPDIRLQCATLAGTIAAVQAGSPATRAICAGSNPSQVSAPTSNAWGGGADTFSAAAAPATRTE